MAAGPGGRAGAPGPPLFLSYPHFCAADPGLARNVVGLACDPARHDLFLDVGALVVGAGVWVGVSGVGV